MRVLTQKETELISGGASEGEFLSVLQGVIFAPFLIAYFSVAAFVVGIYASNQTKSAD